MKVSALRTGMTLSFLLGLLLISAPANAAEVCWTASNGAPVCYDDGGGGVDPGTMPPGSVGGGGSNEAALPPPPPPSQAPVRVAPAPALVRPPEPAAPAPAPARVDVPPALVYQAPPAVQKTPSYVAAVDEPTPVEVPTSVSPVSEQSTAEPDAAPVGSVSSDAVVPASSDVAGMTVISPPPTLEATVELQSVSDTRAQKTTDVLPMAIPLMLGCVLLGLGAILRPRSKGL